MVQFVIGALIFILIAIAIVILVVINFTYKGVRRLREAAEEQFELNQKRKEQKEKNPFGDDYFKSSDSSKQKREQRSQQRTQQADKNTARKTTTSSGVTIIDEREPDKKIFTHDDGEYVEFEEVRD